MLPCILLALVGGAVGFYFLLPKPDIRGAVIGVACGVTFGLIISVPVTILLPETKALVETLPLVALTRANGADIYLNVSTRNNGTTVYSGRARYAGGTECVVQLSAGPLCTLRKSTAAGESARMNVYRLQSDQSSPLYLWSLAPLGMSKYYYSYELIVRAESMSVVGPEHYVPPHRRH